MIEVIQLCAPDVAALSSVLLPLIAPAIELNSGRMTADDAMRGVLNGQATVWVAVDEGKTLGAAVARPVQYSMRKALCVMFIAGEQRGRWEAQMLNALEDGARHTGCDLIEGIGRPGFSRILPGFRVTGYAYEKDLRVQDGAL